MSLSMIYSPTKWRVIFSILIGLFSIALPYVIEAFFDLGILVVVHHPITLLLAVIVKSALSYPFVCSAIAAIRFVHLRQMPNAKTISVIVILLILTNPVMIDILLRLVTILLLYLAFLSNPVAISPYAPCSEITGILPDSPAADAGLQEGMTVCNIQGHNVSFPDGLDDLPTMAYEDMVNVELCNGTAMSIKVAKSYPRIGLKLKCHGVTRGLW